MTTFSPKDSMGFLLHLPVDALRARLYALKYSLRDDELPENFSLRIEALNHLYSELSSQVSPTNEYGDPIEIDQAKILGIQWFALLSSSAVQNGDLSPHHYQSLLSCLLVMTNGINNHNDGLSDNGADGTWEKI